MLSTTGIKYQYPGQGEITFPDIELKDGEHLLVAGSSGCGKTTLLHLLSGILSSQQGVIKVNNTDIARLNSSAMDKFRGEQIGIVYQNAHLFEALSVEDNIGMAAKAVGKNVSREKVQSLMNELSIDHLAKKKPTQLSVGEQQRVNIARAVVNDPSVILADEPTSALDEENCDKVIELLKNSAAKSNAHLVVVTHDQRVKNAFEKSLTL